MSGLIAVGYFLFALFFSLISFVLWTRIALRYFRVSTINPISQAIVSLTNPIVIPIAHMFPKPKTTKSRYDWPCFSILVLVELLKFIAIGTLFLGVKLPWTFLPLYTLADLIVEPCNLLFYALVIRIIMNWTNPRWHHPLVEILRLTTAPLIHAVQKIIPIKSSSFDFSPYVVLVILKIISLYISASLPLHLI